jgi:hypothetical protein
LKKTFFSLPFSRDSHNMKFALVFGASAAASNLDIVSNPAGWIQTGNTFTGAGAWTGRSVFLGKKTEGGMCANADAKLGVKLHLTENRYGELGAVVMKADANTASTGYKCVPDTRKGQGVMLTRDGKKPNNCIHRDFNLGLPTRYQRKLGQPVLHSWPRVRAV